MKLLIALFACWMLASPLAHATTFKCQAANGRVIFQDIPCSAETTTANVTGAQTMVAPDAWRFERIDEAGGRGICLIVSPPIAIGSRSRSAGQVQIRIEHTKEMVEALITPVAQVGSPTTPFDSNLAEVGIYVPGQRFLGDVRLTPAGALRVGAADTALLTDYLVHDDNLTVRVRYMKANGLRESVRQTMSGFVANLQLAKDCVRTLR